MTGSGPDELIFTALGTHVIEAGAGKDTVDSGLDSDTICGGAGLDLLYDINSFTSSFQGLPGKDHVFGGTGDDTVWFNSVVTGDIADGGSGTDSLGGLIRLVEVDCGSGDDRVTIIGTVSDPSTASQVLDGGLGTDQLSWTGRLSGAADLTSGTYLTVQGSQWLGT